jgi:hypothetical protein
MDEKRLEAAGRSGIGAALGELMDVAEKDGVMRVGNAMDGAEGVALRGTALRPTMLGRIRGAR